MKKKVFVEAETVQTSREKANHMQASKKKNPLNRAEG